MYMLKSLCLIVYSIPRTWKIARFISRCSKICLMRELKQRICIWEWVNIRFFLSQRVSFLDDDCLPGGLRGMHPHVPQGAPHRGQGKRKLHLFHIEPCTSHAFLAFFADGQSQLGQLNIKSLTSENTFLC